MTLKLNKIYLESVDSTNTYLKERFEILPDATFVSAGEQTAGRGRLNRKWISPPGQNIYASFMMKNVSQAFHATIVSSLSVIHTLCAAAPDLDFYVKWPNDVYVGNAKIAGVLSEGIWSGGKLAGIVTGMGVNINLAPELLAEIDQRAVSLFSLCGTEFNLKKITEELAKQLFECYILYSSFPDQVFSLWKKENRLIGRSLEFILPDGTAFRAVMRDIEQDGAVLVQKQNGEISRFDCGDLRILKVSLAGKTGEQNVNCEREFIE